MIRFVLDHSAVYGYTVFMEIDGYPAPREMQCTSKAKWETTFYDVPCQDFSYNYYFTNLEDPFGYKFYEDGARRHVTVVGHSIEIYDRFDSPTENYVHTQFWDQQGGSILDVGHAYAANNVRASIFFFPSQRELVEALEELPMELYVQREGLNGAADILEEHYCYRLKRGYGRFELHSVKLRLSDVSWDVGRVLLAEFLVILQEPRAPGGGTPSDVRGCRWRYVIFNGYEGWLNGRRPVECGDERRTGRGSFSSTSLHVVERPGLWVNMTRDESEDARRSICWLINTAQRSIRASVYNINDAAVADALVGAFYRGVDVHVLTSSKYVTSELYLSEQFRKLCAHSVPLTIIMHDDSDVSLNALTNHTKFAIFDEFRVVTGSCNWESRAFDSNSENIVCIEHGKVAELYRCIFDCIRGRPPHLFPVNHETSLVKVFYSRCWGQVLTRHICEEIDRATTNIYMAMFVLRRLRQWEGDRLWDLFDSLAGAKQRGVDVWIILEANCHLGGRYKDRQIPPDTDYLEPG